MVQVQIPAWCSVLRIRFCRGYGIGWSCDPDLISSPGISICFGCSQKLNKFRKEYLLGIVKDIARRGSFGGCPRFYSKKFFETKQSDFYYSVCSVRSGPPIYSPSCIFCYCTSVPASHSTSNQAADFSPCIPLSTYNLTLPFRWMIWYRPTFLTYI